MKTLNPGVSVQLARRTGVEPIFLVSVEIPGSYLYFGDKNITRNGAEYGGKILEVSNLNTQEKVQGIGNIATITVKVEDTTRLLKSRLDQFRFCNQPVKVYQAFTDTTETQLMFAGKLVTPLIWEEEKHTLTFDITTDFESEPVGIENEDGSIIPLGFGTVILACAEKIWEAPHSKLQSLWGDLGGWVRANTAEFWYHPALADQWEAQYGSYDLILSGNWSKWVQNFLPTLQVDDASMFAQDTEIQLPIDAKYGKFWGKWNNNTFTLTRYETLYRAYSGLESQSRFNYDYDTNRTYYKIDTTDGVDYTKVIFKYRGKDTWDSTGDYRLTNRLIRISEVVGDRAYLEDVRLEYLVLNTPMEVHARMAFGGWQLPLEYDFLKGVYPYEEIYAVSAIPVTGLKVLAYQVINNEKRLHELPASYYTIDTNYNGTGATVIKLVKSLDDYKWSSQNPKFEMSWENKIFLSYTSSVSSNVSDIIKYILQNYTSIVPDVSTFSAVHDLVDKYPANFVLKDVKDALTLVSEIAWQARCALYVFNGIAYLKYLSVEPGAIGGVSDEDILEATVVLYYTEIEDIITHLTALWVKNCVDDKDRKLVYTNNTTIYGVRKQEYEFYIYDRDSLIQKSLTFWGLRYSNQWKRVKCKLSLNKINLDFLDCISFVSELLSSKVIVEEISYSSNSVEIEIDCWTPIKAGEATQSPDAWLSDAADIKPDTPLIYSTPAEVYRMNYALGIEAREDSIEEITFGIASADQGEDGYVQVDIYGNGFEANPTSAALLLNITPDSGILTGDKVVVYKKQGKQYTQAGTGNVTIDLDNTDVIQGNQKAKLSQLMTLKANTLGLVKDFKMGQGSETPIATEWQKDTDGTAKWRPKGSFAKE